jgi:hypothetical protein
MKGKLIEVTDEIVYSKRILKDRLIEVDDNVKEITTQSYRS